MVTVTVTSTQPLSAEQKKKLLTAVEKKHGKEVKFVEHVDEAMIGGISVQVGSMEFDATVRGKLNQVRQELRSKLA